MQFNSYIFALFFMPVSVIAYYLLNKINHTAGKLGLILLSVVFYLYAGYDVAIGLGVSIILNYLVALYLSKAGKGRKAMFILAIILNVAHPAYQTPRPLCKTHKRQERTPDRKAKLY